MRWIALLALFSSPAVAAEVQCVIQVDGTEYLSEPCEVSISPDSITLGVSDTKSSKYFAYINDDETGSPVGYWNGPEAASHAHYDLGAMTADGQCWVNDHAKVCAYGPSDIGFGN